jgi:hypothetical protein
VIFFKDTLISGALFECWDAYCNKGSLQKLENSFAAKERENEKGGWGAALLLRTQES